MCSSDLFPSHDKAVIGVKPHLDALVFYKFSDGEFQYKYEAEIDDWMVSTCNHPQSVIKAMRRIIKEPKRWTWEDKKAGRLPEVGAKCNHCHSVDKRTVLSVTDKYVGIECDNSDINPYFVTHAEFIQYYIPIETPAEKAQRLEDEFINYVLRHEKSQINSSEELVAAKRAIKLAYKLQLSGELQAPKGE